MSDMVDRQANSVVELQSLDREVIRGRTLDLFPNAYLTVVSIIQGGALALLVPNSRDAVERASGIDLVAVVAQMMITWGTILVIFFMYAWYTIVIRYAPTIIDSFIPLALGTSEILMACVVDEPKVWLWAALPTAISGALAFEHSVRRANVGMYESRNVANRVISILKWMSGISGFLAACGLVGALVGLIFDASRWCSIFLVVPFSGGLCCMIYISESGLSFIYRESGWERHHWGPRVMAVPSTGSDVVTTYEDGR